MNAKELLEVSKAMSYILRHKPEEFGLALDEQGGVVLDKLFHALVHQPKFNKLQPWDIIQIVNEDKKGRYELYNNKIRALYGHSIKGKIKKIPVKPPYHLYHGTTMFAMIGIFDKGLKHMGRQYACMSTDKETAKNVGIRRTNTPMIVTIQALRAYNDGIEFYNENGTWLSEYVPSKYII